MTGPISRVCNGAGGVAVGATRRKTARLAATAMALYAAVACPVGHGAEAALSMAGPWDMIAFEVKSWGRPVTWWRLLRSGSGSWTEIVEARDERAPGYSAVWHEVEAGEQGYARVTGELARLPLPAPDPATCSERMHDLPYGTVRLTRAATTIEIAWNSGCMDADYRAFVAILKAADSIVADWGRAGRVLRTEPLDPPR